MHSCFMCKLLRWLLTAQSSKKSPSRQLDSQVTCFGVLEYGPGAKSHSIEAKLSTVGFLKNATI